MAKPVSIEVWNPNGKYRVVSTKPMPGTRWINLLVEQDCRVEVTFIFFFFPLYKLSSIIFQNFDGNLAYFSNQICTQKKTILSIEDIIALIGDKCDGVIGQVSLLSFIIGSCYVNMSPMNKFFYFFIFFIYIFNSFIWFCVFIS